LQKAIISNLNKTIQLSAQYAATGENISSLASNNATLQDSKMLPKSSDNVNGTYRLVNELQI